MGQAGRVEPPVCPEDGRTDPAPTALSRTGAAIDRSQSPQRDGEMARSPGDVIQVTLRP